MMQANKPLRSQASVVILITIGILISIRLNGWFSFGFAPSIGRLRPRGTILGSPRSMMIVFFDIIVIIILEAKRLLLEAQHMPHQFLARVIHGDIELINNLLLLGLDSHSTGDVLGPLAADSTTLHDRIVVDSLLAAFARVVRQDDLVVILGLVI
jgi:hypothetical protein